jgi:hypothetical protein
VWTLEDDGRSRNGTFFATTRFATPPSNREVAAELVLGVDTVKFHLNALYAVFGVTGLPPHRKRVALAQRALEDGVIAAHELLEPV